MNLFLTNLSITHAYIIIYVCIHTSNALYIQFYSYFIRNDIINTINILLLVYLKQKLVIKNNL